MAHKDPRVDAFIANAEPFARPILKHLRSLVHATVPAVVEDMKWGMPHFTYKGMFCGMGSFKNHCTFGFWKHSLIAARVPGLLGNVDTAMGSVGRITARADLPSDAVLKKMLKIAVELNDAGVKGPKKKPVAASDRVLEIPPYFSAAVKKNKQAAATFDGFPYSCKKEYVQWVTEAKTEATREKRLATTVEWLAEGKRRNWKYENC